MSESEKQKAGEVDLIPPVPGPLVFISHDTRDAELAEAFSKLLKSVSAGMIKTFRSSDKKGSEGIDFGEEWYKRLMSMLQSTSDVVCLFTERSLERPWILFEAGVAKGKLTVPVVGVALGVPLSHVSAGPFYQFQNMDDSEADLTKLVHQLARRIPSLELDSDVVRVQVQGFKATESAILKAMPAGGKKGEKEEADESQVAKLAEEMKALPSRVAERLLEAGDPIRRRTLRSFHPMMLEEIMGMAMADDRGDPGGILLLAGLLRDEAPWLYEFLMEIYRAVRSGNQKIAESEISRLRRFSELAMRGPLGEELGFRNKEGFILFMEVPRMVDRLVRRAFRELESEKPTVAPRLRSEKS